MLKGSCHRIQARSQTIYAPSPLRGEHSSQAPFIYAFAGAQNAVETSLLYWLPILVLLLEQHYKGQNH